MCISSRTPARQQPVAKMSSRLYAALIIVLLPIKGAVACTDVRSLSQRLDAALARYEREAAPARPARVRLALHLRHAAVRDDATSHMLGDLAVSWMDPRISWNVSEWGCDSVVASADRLWLPDVSLLNGIGTAEGGPAARVRLANDGRVAWLQRYDAAVPIALDLARWPADMQIAIFKFGSRTLDNDELELEIDDSMPAVTFEAGAWELVGMSGGASSDGGGVVWAVRLRRRSAAARAGAAASLVAVIVLLIAAALLPAPQRPSLCAAAALVAALWLSSAAWRVGGGGGSRSPGAVAALGVACAAAGAAAVAAAISVRLPRAARPPPSLTAAVAALPRCCKPHDEESGGARSAWTVLTLFLDRVTAAALLVTMIVCLTLFF